MPGRRLRHHQSRLHPAGGRRRPRPPRPHHLQGEEEEEEGGGGAAAATAAAAAEDDGGDGGLGPAVEAPAGGGEWRAQDREVAGRRRGRTRVNSSLSRVIVRSARIDRRGV